MMVVLGRLEGTVKKKLYGVNSARPFVVPG